MTTQRRYDAEASRRDILRAAEELFVAHGFAATSTAQIARLAGVAQSQINYHFESKEKLWLTLHEQKFEEYYHAQMELLAGPERGVQTVRESMEAYFRFFQSDQRFARLMMWNLLELGNLGEGQGEDLLRFGVELIAHSQREGRLRDDLHPSMLLMAFLGVISWWFQAREAFVPKLGLDGDPRRYDDSYLDTVLKIFAAGISPQPEERS